MKAALWTRVSTHDQDTANQLTALQAEAGRRGLDIAATWQVDASAWKGDHKPELRALLTGARRHEFEVLLIWALDRLERGGIVETFLACRQLWASGVVVVSLQEPWLEQSGPMRELLLAIFSWVAQMESQRRSERVKAGLARRKAEGQVLGRPAGAKDKRKRKRSGYFRRYAE